MTLDNKIVMSKITREDFTKFQQYCDMNEETTNACLKRLISEKIDNPEPTKIAGKSVFDYNRQKDNFSWKILLDNDSIITMDDNLPAETIEQLLESLMDAIDKRQVQIKKSMADSVSIPSRLLRMRK